LAVLDVDFPSWPGGRLLMTRNPPARSHRGLLRASRTADEAEHGPLDTSHDEPIERITPNGIRTSRGTRIRHLCRHAHVFDGVTGAFDRIDIRGLNGLRLKDVWADSPRTYLGMLAVGFPNMLMVLGPHTARGNIPQAIEHSVEFQVGILRFMREHDCTRVETRPGPQRAPRTGL
jgi:cation diffusion facilitator CzcD-associated flavoprotein CzcO